MRRLAPFVLAAVLLAACSSGGEVADFGDAAPDPDGPTLPADLGIDVAEAPAPEEVPPPDAWLFEGGWPETAAYVAREAEEGRATLVNLFASWCDPCERELPLLFAAAEANPEITFLGIDHQDRREDGEAFVEEQGFPFATIYDFEGDVAFAVGARGMPTTVVFDHDGRMVGRIIGEATESSLEDLLDEVR